MKPALGGELQAPDAGTQKGGVVRAQYRLAEGEGSA